MLDFIFFLMPL